VRPICAEVLEKNASRSPQRSCLEYCPTEASPADIGGLEALSNWLTKRAWPSAAEARALWPAPAQGGWLLVGPQGTGKSLTAKAIAHQLGDALLRLIVGRPCLPSGGAEAKRATANESAGPKRWHPAVLWIG